MRTSFILPIAALAALLAPRAHGDPMAVSTDLVYALDTIASPPRAIQTAADLAKTASYFAGETVTATAPDGTVSPVVTSATADGAVAFSSTFDVGGLWTITNDGEGSAVFSVRHALFGTQGAGTAASPLRLVDGDELADLVDAGTAGDGSVFTLADGDTTLFAALAIPAGFRLVEAGDGAWRIVTSANGLQYLATAVEYPFDSQQPGPDRVTRHDRTLAVAYSGDDWARDASASATLTLTPPTGAATVMNLAGTGATPFNFSPPGEWTVTLAMAGGMTRIAHLNVRSEAFLMIVR